MFEYVYFALICYGIGLVTGVVLVLSILLKVMMGLSSKMRPKP